MTFDDYARIDCSYLSSPRFVFTPLGPEWLENLTHALCFQELGMWLVDDSPAIIHAMIREAERQAILMSGGFAD